MTASVRTDFPAAGSSPEKRWVGPSFSRAAAGYDQVAAMQRQVGEQLLAWLPDAPFEPGVILDVGAGTGYCTARLAERFPGAGLIALDIAEGMLRTLHQRPGLQERAMRICGDGESLPLQEKSVDLVFSNLALQWCVDLPAALAEFRRVLRPGGVLLFSTFGDGTLAELRIAWGKADGYSHVNVFLPQASVDAVLAGGHSEVRAERQVIRYPGVDALLRELKGLGARNLTQNRPRHLTGKGVFGKMLSAYPQSAENGCIEASFEVILGRLVMPVNGTCGGG